MPLSLFTEGGVRLAILPLCALVGVFSLGGWVCENGLLMLNDLVAPMEWRNKSSPNEGQLGVGDS